MAIDASRIAAALHALADAVLGKDSETAETAAATPTPRGRGRPPKGEGSTPNATTGTASAVAVGQTGTGVASPATTASAAGDDPFAPAAPKVTEADVRAALVALKDVTSQENALKVLKEAGGASNITELKPDKYGAVVAAAQAATVAAGKAAAGTPNAADDPFGETAAAAEAVPTPEELKALIVETQKRASSDTVQKIVMKHGGKAVNAATGVEGPNFKALPVSSYLAVAKELKGLPTTK